MRFFKRATAEASTIAADSTVVGDSRFASSGFSDFEPSRPMASRFLPPPLRSRWGALADRERRLLGVAAVVIGGYLVWSLALAPAWRTIARAPAQLDAMEIQLQQMQALAAETKTLRGIAPVPLAQAQAALSAATERLGAQAKLSLQGERAILTLKGVGSAQLAAWLAEARAGARARVVEGTLNQNGPGVYDGSLTLSLESSR